MCVLKILSFSCKTVVGIVSGFRLHVKLSLHGGVGILEVLDEERSVLGEVEYILKAQFHVSSCQDFVHHVAGGETSSHHSAVVLGHAALGR